MAKFTLVFLLFVSNIVFANETIRLAVGEWSPYISETLEKDGMLSQITAEAFALKDVNTSLGFFPWGRAIQLAKNGEWDGCIALVRLAEREPYYFFSDPIYTGNYAFFYLRGSKFKWKNIGDLKDVTIASTIGFGAMGEEFIRAEKEGVIKVLRVPSDSQSFKMLLAKRAEIVPSDIEVGYVMARNLFGKEAEKITHDSNRLISKAEYRIAISKKIKNGQALIDKFNAGLAQLRRSGRYDEIVNHWYNQPVYKEAVPTNYLRTNHGYKTRGAANTK